MGALDQIVVVVQAEELLASDDRPLAAVRGLERAVPGLKMEWRISQDGKPIALPHRDVWLAEGLARGRVQTLCNGDENYPITLGGLRDLAQERPQWKLVAHFPVRGPALSAALDILEQVAEGAR